MTALDLARLRYREGTVDFLVLLDADFGKLQLRLLREKAAGRRKRHRT